MKNVGEILNDCKVIPVMVIEQLEDAVPLAQALVEGGLKVLEVTLRTPVAIDAIREIKNALPQAIVGTGTVTNMSTLQASIKAEADFMVSPGTTNELLRAAVAEGINLLPGVATPSEAMRLLDEGYLFQKFFPAQAAGGIPMLKSLAGPLPQVSFCPTGGISLNNAADYLALPNVTCVGGSWMLDSQLISRKDWNGIKAMAISASRIDEK